MHTPPEPRGKTVLAFAIIYIVWGSTFLAIRVGVHEVPPLLFAAMRFTTAGLVLCGWTVARGAPLPTRRQWTSVALLAFLIFVVNYGLLFWAEQRIPSGVAAVMLATIPLFMTLFEVLFLGTQKLTARLALALLLGLLGVGVLMGDSFGPLLAPGSLGPPIDKLGAAALIFAAICWSIGSTLTRKLPLPASKGLNSGVQMLTGGVMLFLAAAVFGEYKNFHPHAVSTHAWLALLYLITAGSLIAFTAYIWLMQHESPTRISTYAYVNPVVAVLIGFFFGAETLNLRILLGILFILISVIVITTTPSKKPIA